MNVVLDWIFVVLFGGAVLYVAGEGLARLWQRFRPEPPARWKLTLVDQDGIPLKTFELSVQGVARLITDLNAGFYK